MRSSSTTQNPWILRTRQHLTPNRYVKASADNPPMPTRIGDGLSTSKTNEQSRTLSPALSRRVVGFPQATVRLGSDGHVPRNVHIDVELIIVVIVIEQRDTSEAGSVLLPEPDCQIVIIG